MVCLASLFYGCCHPCFKEPWGWYEIAVDKDIFYTIFFIKDTNRGKKGFDYMTIGHNVLSFNVEF